MNQLKQKIKETEKEIEKLTKKINVKGSWGIGKNGETQIRYNKRRELQAILLSLRFAEEIQDENIKRLKMNLYNTSPAIIKDEPRCSKIIDEVFE